MTKDDVLSQAFAYLRRNHGVNVLIVMIITLCMGCFLVMRALGAGGVAQFAASLSSGDPAEITVTAGPSGAKLDDAAIGAFRDIEGVEAATGVIELPLCIQVGSYEAQTIQVTAVDAQALQGKLAFVSGGMFSDRADSPQIVLGYAAQMHFLDGGAPQNAAANSAQGAEPTPPPVNWLGQRAQVSFAGAAGGKSGGVSEEPGVARLYMGNITGILKEDKSDRNTQAFMNLAAAKKLLQENYNEAQALGLSASNYAEAYVFVKNVGKVQAVLDALDQMGCTAQSAVADLDNLQEELSLQRTLLIVIEVFSVLTAFMAALCILLPRRSARGEGKAESPATRFIGSAALGIIGGVAAVLTACFFTLIVNTSSTETIMFGLHFGQNANLLIPPAAALETVGISVIIVCFFEWIAYKRA